MFKHLNSQILHHSKRAFTLIEMMIVIGIILSLTSLIFFPYTHYMQRASVSASIDTVGQGWIIAHKSIRNGQVFSESKIANKILIMRPGSNEIEQYILSGMTIPEITSFGYSPDIRKEKSITLDSNIYLLGFSGVTLSKDDILGYLIEAPYARGTFFTGSRLPFSSTGIFLQIGYNGADIESGRARDILLRPYLQ